MMAKQLRFLLMSLMLLGVTISIQATDHQLQPVLAQDDAATCETLVVQAVREIGSACRELGTNEACYGNNRIDAELNDDAISFSASGDIVGVESITRLTTQPADPDTGEWGIAVLDIQADLPEDSDGSVRLLLFGGVELDPVVPEGIAEDAPTCSVSNSGGRGVNMRVGPGTDFAIVDSLRPGEEAVGYGIDTSGEWIRTARGWVAETVTANDCDAVNVIEETSDAYTAPMQNFTLSLTETGACEAAPNGLLIQAPDNEVANILINDVELRVGSTAFLTIAGDNDEMIIGNFDGDVTVTTNGVGRRLRPGQETLIDMRQDRLEREPLFPRPFGEEMGAMRDDMLETLPTPIQRPGIFVPVPGGGADGNIGGPTDGITSNVAQGTGQWQSCGSCNTCGYPQNECVTSPEGQCLWDPATCRAGFDPNVPSLLSPNAVNCIANSSGFNLVPYNDPAGTTFLATASADFVPPTGSVSAAPNASFTAVEVFYVCPPLGITKTIQVTAINTEGITVNTSFTVTGN